MNLKEFESMLRESGMPVAYRDWKDDDKPSIPFLVYYQTKETPFRADNVVYFNQVDLAIELYTDKKEPNNEKIVESLLNENELIFEKYEYYWEDDDLHETLYTTQIHY